MDKRLPNIKADAKRFLEESGLCFRLVTGQIVIHVCKGGVYQVDLIQEPKKESYR